MERGSTIRNIDWFTISIYLLLAVMGWFAICGASYSYIETDFLEFLQPSERTGKQAMWMIVSLLVGSIILCFDKRIYKDWSYILYIFFILLGIVTIFVSRDIKGSHSWLQNTVKKITNKNRTTASKAPAIILFLFFLSLVRKGITRKIFFFCRNPGAQLHQLLFYPFIPSLYISAVKDCCLAFCH